MKVLTAVSKCHGFNIGMNQGEVAGAGIAGHLHQHIVPRWRNDANFFPIIAETKALPKLLGEVPQSLRTPASLPRSSLDLLEDFEKAFLIFLWLGSPPLQVLPGNWFENDVHSGESISRSCSMFTSTPGTPLRMSMMDCNSRMPPTGSRNSSSVVFMAE